MTISASSYFPTSLAANRLANANRFAMTREQTRRTLTERVDTVSKLVGDCIAYIDTVQVLLPHQLKLARLRQHNHGKIIPFRSKAFNLPGYRIHQPSPATLEYISIECPKHLVTRFDLAFDFTVVSAHSQLLFADFLNQHLTQPWRGKRKRTMYEGTVYLGPRSARRNVAVYVSASKITNQPAVHLEMRYSRAGACRRRDVHRIGDLPSVDINTCIHRDIKLSAICWRIADRAVDKVTEKLVRQYAHRAETVKTPNSIYDRRISFDVARRRLLEPFLRSMQDNEGRVPCWDDRVEFGAQDCIDWRVLRDAAVHVPATALIKVQPLLIWR